MRVLLIEDNKRLSESLRLTLEDDGYAVDAVYDGLDGEEMGMTDVYDIIILDVMLPGKNGITVCQSLRNKRMRTPVLMLTARDALEDRVAGLDSGADDYLVKPFEVDELRARIRALLRRESGSKSGSLEIEDLVLDPAKHTVRRNDQDIDLTAKEFALLEYLMRHPNHLVTREMAESHLWSYDSLVSSNVVDVYIRRLRRKIDDPFEVKLLETLRDLAIASEPRRKIDEKIFRIKPSFHSIRFRLVMWFTGILVLVLVSFSVFVFYNQSRDIQGDALYRLDRKLGDIANALWGSSSIPPVLQSTDVFIFIDANGKVLISKGIDSDHDVIALMQHVQHDANVQNAEGTSDQLTWWRQDWGLDHGNYLFIIKSFSINNQKGFAILGSPYDSYGLNDRLLITLLLGSLLTVVIVLIGGFWLADRAMRPVHTITQTAKSISETDLNRRLNMSGKDELAELANTFDGMLARLQAAFERQKQFVADASHELRTPLTIINLEASRALSGKRSAEEYQRTIGVIRSENEFMSHLVNDLLTLARMDAGQMLLEKKPLDLSDIALDVVERLEPLAERKKVKLEMGELPEVKVLGDRKALIQMLTNLVENGIKYTTGEDKIVRVETGLDAGEAWVKVSDDGEGIPEEHLPHLFDRFYRADNARAREEADQQGGMGLGLSIVDWVVRAHGGRVSVESAPGKGTTFLVKMAALPG